MGEQLIKCVAIGDGCVGKTCLLLSLCGKDGHNNYTPTIFENHLWQKTHNGKTYEVQLIDTAGQEDYEMLRKQSYESANIFLVCFDVCNSNSFTHVNELWLPEIEESPDAVKILVGTKSDLRNDPETIDKLNSNNKIFVTTSSAKKFAENHKMQYVECSSKTKENIDEIGKLIIEATSKSTIDNKSSSSNACCCVHPVLRLAQRVLCCKNNY